MKKDIDRMQMVKSAKRQRKPARSVLPLFLFLIIAAATAMYGLMKENNWVITIGFIVALVVSQSVKIAQQWEKVVVLRLGKFHGLAGPGLFFTLPIVDTTPFWIDQRIIATSFNAEQTLTKDNVPVDVDAVLFWMVWDAEKAALEVEDYREAVSWAAQTALRDVIGRTMLSDMLAGRENIDSELQEMIDKRTVPWGVAVQSVEIRDVIIPEGLQDAMSREAQADRERKARIILGSAEQEIAASFVAAADIYGDSTTALQLRSLNVLYESLKKQGGLVVVPSQMADAPGLGVSLGVKSQLIPKLQDNKQNCEFSEEEKCGK